MTQRPPLAEHIEQLIFDYSRHPDEPMTSADLHQLARAAKELATARHIHEKQPPDTASKKSKGLSKKTLQLIEHDILGIKR